ncbi:MAG: hypothetical protein IT313_13440 [Anaerolineales bacterium]|nr:hypothetical protein [Anaerolineales bacterium]
MKLRKLNDNGLVEFNNYLDLLEEDGKLQPPFFLLSDPSYSIALGTEVEMEIKPFTTRFEVGNYLYSVLGNLGLSDLERDTQLWAWCSLYFFDVLCPLGDKEVRKPRERAAYIPEPENFKRYYRHLLLGPYLIYRAHKDQPTSAMALLSVPPHKISEVEAQIAATMDLVTNPSIVEIATRLYYNPKERKLKKGAQNTKGGGIPRRLVAFLNQVDLTWDLYFASADTLWKMLPKEFEKFAKSIG